MLKNKSKAAVCCTIFLICCMVFSSMSALSTVGAYQSRSQPVSDALAYLASEQSSVDGSISTFTVSCWAAMAINASGQNPNDWSNNGPSLVDYLVANKDLVNNASASDVSRYILAMVSSNVDPRAVDDTDFVSILEGSYNNDQLGETLYLTDDYWGIMALVAAGSPNSTIISGSVDYIKAHQNSVDFGWGWDDGTYGGYSDVDDTAAAIMALIAAGEAPTQSNVTAGVGYLHSMQNLTTGGFDSWGYMNSGSASWVMGAVVSLGQHPGQWPLNDSDTLLDNLLSLQNVGGSFNYTTDDEAYTAATSVPVDKAWYTSYAIIALTFKPYPVAETPDITLVGDFYKDDAIDDVDRLILVFAIFAYYIDPGTYDPIYDLDKDGDIDGDDLDLFDDIRAKFES